MQTATIESIDRPTGGVLVWIAAHDEVIPSMEDHGQEQAASGLRLQPTGHRAGRVLLRTMLKCYLGQEGADAQIVPDGRGKPSLLRQDGSKCGVEINISHSRTHVAVAMSYCGPVGIDTESRWLSEAQLRRMSARILTPDAAKRFAALNADAQPNELLRQWCAREALLKAWGVGLTGDLRSVHLPVPLPASPLTVDGHVVQVISRAPVVCLAHPVLDGRRVRYCAGRPFNKSES